MKSRIIRSYVSSYTNKMFRIIPIYKSPTVYICTTTLRDKIFVLRDKHLEVYERMVDVDVKEIKNAVNQSIR